MKTAAVFGAGGLIGNAMVSYLKNKGYWVRGIDLVYPKYNKSSADEFIIADLRDKQNVWNSITISIKKISHDVHVAEYVSELYQYAADMGGAAYIFSGEHDADVMSNSAQININTCVVAKSIRGIKVFYSSSACMYPQDIQHEIHNPALAESMAYPGNPDSEYGWEKLFSERLYKSYEKNYGLNVRIARFHNIFGINGSWNNGKEKAPAAICRKVAEANNGDTITIWGDGLQTRSFLNVDECLKTVDLLMQSDITEPLNIGSDELISINDLAKMVIEISGKDLKIEHDLTKPQGVRGRNSDNTKIKSLLGYAPIQHLKYEMDKLYHWVERQISVIEYAKGKDGINRYKID